MNTLSFVYDNIDVREDMPMRIGKLGMRSRRLVLFGQMLIASK